MRKSRTRAERDWGLPRLTVTVAADVLEIPRSELVEWVEKVWRPGRTPSDESARSRFKNDRRPLPEVALRVYRAWERGQAAGSRDSEEHPLILALCHRCRATLAPMIHSPGFERIVRRAMPALTEGAASLKSPEPKRANRS